MTELINNNLTKTVTKDYLDVISKVGPEYRELINRLDETLVGRFPEIEGKFIYAQIAVTGDFNHGTNDRTSNINLYVVYSEWGRGNFTIRRSKTLNFNTDLTVDYQNENDEVASPVKFNVYFLHISDYLKQLSKSDYRALEILTSRYQIYSNISDPKVDCILSFYNFDNVKENILNELKNVSGKLLDGILTDAEKEKRKQCLRKHLIVLNILSNKANAKLLRCGEFWDMTDATNISSDQVKPYIKTPDSLTMPSEEYLDFLDDMYYDIVK